MTKLQSVHRIILALILINGCTVATAEPSTLPRYRVTDLGTLGGQSSGYGINNSGQVTGFSNTLEEVPLGQTPIVHAFLWQPNTPNGTAGILHDLGSPGVTSYGYGINDRGQVTGIVQTGPGFYAFHWTPTIPNGTSGTQHGIGTPDRFSEGRAINGSGQITGSATREAGFESRALIWNSAAPVGATDRLHYIDFQSRYNVGHTWGYGINDGGRVTGAAWFIPQSNCCNEHAFVWTPNSTGNAENGTLQDLGTLGGLRSTGFAINANGLVTGEADTTELRHAFLYDGAMHDLGTLGGVVSVGHDINFHGHVTGWSLTDDHRIHSFLYTSGTGMVDLNSLIDPQSGWELQEARGINDIGQIVGTGFLNGLQRAFLLTPVPEPSTAALWGIGGVALALSAARSLALRPRSRNKPWARLNRSTAHTASSNVPPYLQASDSPFAAFTFDYFYLEDFEDGFFNVPGVTKSAGNIIGPGLAADSVDADDGSIDGLGNGGRSLFVAGGSLSFTFDPSILGGLPTHVGIVRTDGGSTATGPRILFEAFGPGMNPLGTISSAFGDGVSNGTTAEDRFLGWFDPNGILAIRIPSGVFEVDHLQYGSSVPEPSAALLVVSAFTVLGLHKLRKAALRVGFARISLYAVAALLCRSPTAGATDFVIDQQHYTTSNFINSVGCCDGMGQEFMPTFRSLDIMHLQLEQLTPELFVNIRKDSITGPIVGRSSNTVRTGEHWRVGEFVQFEFEPQVSLNPESLYIIEIRSPIPPSPSGTLLVNDGAFQWRDEHRYARGRMIYDGMPSEADIVFRAGSRRVPGTVYETGFDESERLHLATGPLAGQRDWRAVGDAAAVTVSPSPPNQDIDYAIRIAGAGLNPDAGVLSAVALRSSNLHPIDYGNPIVSMKARVRLDGPGTSANGGSGDDLISANVGVTDAFGATIAELILSSNGNAYAFAGDDPYSFETPATLGEFHAVELRLNYLSRSAEFFLNHQRLGALPFAAEVHNVFGEPFFALSALDTARLNPSLYSAWFDDLLIQQMPVPEPPSLAIFLFGSVGLLTFYEQYRRRCAMAAGVIVVSLTFSILPRPASAATFTVANVPSLIDAINAANQNSEPDTITLAPSTVFSLTEINDITNGSTGLPQIIANERLTILGNGSVIERSVESATPNFRLFDITAEASLALENLTVQNGLTDFNSPNGGAVYNAGTLTLSNVLIHNNFATGRAGAPCIRCSSGRGGPGWFGLGAGVYSSGFLEVDASVIRNNQASGGPGGFGTGGDGRGGDGHGGGLYLAEGSAIFHGSQMTGNSAVGGSGSPAGNGYGGGIYIANAQVSIDESTLTHLKDNVASTNYSDVFGPFSVIPNVNLLPGDYNGDEVVNAADYVAWRKTGATQAGYNAWRTNFGRTAGTEAGGFTASPPAPVPEPATLALIWIAIASLAIASPARYAGRDDRSHTDPVAD